MKKIIVYILVGFLSVSSISLSYYRSVHAMEWAGGALAFEEALKWTLGLLGITATAGMTDAYWTQYGDEFEEYAAQQNITDAEVAEWQLKLCQGILDKGSECWTAFKSWANSLISGSGSVDTNNNLSNILRDNFNLSEAEISQVISNFNYWDDWSSYTINSNGDTFNLNSVIFGSVTLYQQSNKRIEICFFHPDEYDLIYDNSYVKTVKKAGESFYTRWIVLGVDNDYHARSFFNNDLTQIGVYPSSVSTNNIFSQYNNYSLDSVSDSDFESVVSDVSSLDVISGSADNTEDKEVSIPMPGQATSDDTVSSDAYQDIIDRINDGTISQEEGVQEIQDLVRVITYDTVTDEVIPVRPDPDTGENEKIDDAIKENVNNAGFTLWGLEKIFPFCIPWDIYAFMNILVAEPVAPKFSFPIKSVNGQTEEIEVDLTPFEPVAVVVRYVFDFLFIVGLGLLTRGLIGGGDSD